MLEQESLKSRLVKQIKLEGEDEMAEIEVDRREKNRMQ